MPVFRAERDAIIAHDVADDLVSVAISGDPGGGIQRGASTHVVPLRIRQRSRFATLRRVHPRLGIKFDLDALSARVVGILQQLAEDCMFAGIASEDLCMLASAARDGGRGVDALSMRARWFTSTVSSLPALQSAAWPGGGIAVVEGHGVGLVVGVGS